MIHAFMLDRRSSARCCCWPSPPAGPPRCRPATTTASSPSSWSCGVATPVSNTLRTTGGAVVGGATGGAAVTVEGAGPPASNRGSEPRSRTRDHRDDPDEDGARDERRSTQRHVGTLSARRRGRCDHPAGRRGVGHGAPSGLSTTVSLRGEPEGIGEMHRPAVHQGIPSPVPNTFDTSPEMPVMHGRRRSKSSTTCSPARIRGGVR